MTTPDMITPEIMAAHAAKYPQGPWIKVKCARCGEERFMTMELRYYGAIDAKLSERHGMCTGNIDVTCRGVGEQKLVAFQEPPRRVEP